jgi:hypothetical protein
LIYCAGVQSAPLSGGAVEVASAGSRRQGSKPLHPEAVVLILLTAAATGLLVALAGGPLPH